MLNVWETGLFAVTALFWAVRTGSHRVTPSRSRSARGSSSREIEVIMFTLPLTSLPVELIIKILNYLDFRSLLVCTEVCKSLKFLANSVELRYKVELAAAGLEDGPPSTLSSSDRLRRLVEHQTAWKNLRWKSEKIVPMLRGGVWELYGGVLAQSRPGAQTLVFRQIPSEIRGIEEKEWESDTGMRIRDFGMDPTQDLLVVVENPNGNGIYRVHLLTMSTGKPHPNACRPAVISHSPHGVNFSFAIQTCGEYVGVMFIGSTDIAESELLIWNWKTGMLQTALHGREIASFSFLTHRHILIGYVQQVFLDHPQDPPSLRVIDFKACPKEPIHVRDADYECALDFPAMLPDGAVLAAAIRSDPAPIWKPSEDLGVPFQTARNDRLFVVTCWVAESHNITTLVLFVPSATVLSHMSGEKKRHYAWYTWGPSGARMRMAPAGHSMVWVCYVFGQSFVAPYRAINKERTEYIGPKMVQIFDFNPLAVQRALSREEEDENTKIITSLSEISVNGVFTEPIRTFLPYLWRKTEVPYDPEHSFDAVMLSEDAIITVTSDFNCREYRILSF